MSGPGHPQSAAVGSAVAHVPYDRVPAPRPLPAAAAAYAVPDWAPALRDLLGAEYVHTNPADLYVYSRDRSPYAIFRTRDAGLAATLPCAVACPGSAAELAAVVRFARDRGIALIPYGAGSGVLGGALPIAHELVVDLKRLNRLVSLDETSRTVVVQAGMNGAQFEQALNARGYTCGHQPQSLHMSTVGGWAACRGAGQNSTRYGKIEDIVLGCEGTLGILSELTLRCWALPEARHGVVLAFPTQQAGLDALRAIIQDELRPAVVRLYDAYESAQRTHGEGPYADRPFMAILEFSGTARLAAVERDLALEIAARHGGLPADDRPYRDWLEHRYASLSVRWQSRDYYVDTIDVTASWTVLPVMHARMAAAVREACAEATFGAHWSHFYSEGACQYATVRLPPMPEPDALATLSRIWNAVQHVCLDLGGSISHHHGVGLFRSPWMQDELGAGLGILQALKDHLDPQNLFVPGKLGLRPPGGSRP